MRRKLREKLESHDRNIARLSTFISETSQRLDRVVKYHRERIEHLEHEAESHTHRVSELTAEVGKLRGAMATFRESGTMPKWWGKGAPERAKINPERCEVCAHWIRDSYPQKARVGVCRARSAIQYSDIDGICLLFKKKGESCD